MATQRQRALASKILENIGKPMGEAMREVGYSKNYSDNPRLLIRTKGWKELMEERLPDSKLISVHAELLKNKNWRARDAALDKAYKLKGKYQAEKLKMVDPYEDMTTEELQDKRNLIAERIKGLKFSLELHSY